MPAKTAATTTPQSDVYDQLETLLKRYAPPFAVCPAGKVGTKRSYALWSPKETVIGGRKYPGVNFVTVIEQKGYVGFYFMPIYMNPELQSKVPERLLKMKKGKCCFHVKAIDKDLLAEIKSALDLGLRAFQKNSWL